MTSGIAGTAVCGHEKHYAHGKCKSCYEKAWRTPRYNRKSNLKKSYGMSLKEFYKLVKKQNGCCKICGRKNSGTSRSKNLYVDHDHKTGVIRGLLCNPCNRALGYMEDDPNRLIKAAKYLEECLTQESL